PDLFIEFASFNSDQNKSILTSSKLYKSNIERADVSLFEDKLVTFNSFLNNEQLYEPNMMLDDFILAD
ncbi:27124_t:CDS:2, partial [Gigaspora margarita]